MAAYFRQIVRFCPGILLAGASLAAAWAQAPAGPTTLPAPPNVVRLPANPAPEKAPLPPEEIIRRFGQTEDATAAALGQFTYKRTIRLEEIGADGKPAGRAEAVALMSLEPDGSRRLRPAPRGESTLRYAALEPDALEFFSNMPNFPFTTSQLPKYDIRYQASEPVDDLTTYVFRVEPKQLSRTAALFSGLIWVDDRDFAVVKTYGKWVSESGEATPPSLPFSYYESYRTYVAGRYWMPAYMRSDGTTGGSAHVPLRLTIRWEEYKQIPGTTLAELPRFSPPAPAEQAPENAPAPPGGVKTSEPGDPGRPTLAPRSGR